MNTMAGADGLKSHYQMLYGDWSGSPGTGPNFDRCCADVRDKYHWGGYQCTRLRVHGPDGAFCKQHDPAAPAERNRVAKAKYDAESRRRSIQFAGSTFLSALEKIANGHNDPRALAAEVIAPYLKAKEAAETSEAK